MQPAFVGIAEANSIVRVYATRVNQVAPHNTPILLGVARTGTDLTDGVANDQNGLWEITAEPINLAEFMKAGSGVSKKELVHQLRGELIARIDEEKATIVGPILKSREEIIGMVLRDKGLIAFMDEMAAKAKKGKGDIAAVRKEARKYLDEILLSLRPILKKTRHRLEINCPANLKIVSFPGAFSQIFTNLITNSVTHAFGDNEAGRILIFFAEDNNTLAIRYIDNGRGISSNHLGHIFDPFFTTNREMGGSGLGLHIIYNIITQQLYGSISCHCPDHGGTEFFITLPMAKFDGANEENDDP